MARRKKSSGWKKCKSYRVKDGKVIIGSRRYGRRGGVDGPRATICPGKRGGKRWVTGSGSVHKLKALAKRRKKR